MTRAGAVAVVGARLTHCDTSVEAVFMECQRSGRRALIESTDGLSIAVSGVGSEGDNRIAVLVEDLSGHKPGFERLRGSTLSLARASALRPGVPLSGIARFTDGESAVLRIPGVRYVLFE